MRVVRRDRVAVVTLDDPARRNALSADLVGRLSATFDDLEADDAVGAVVLTGSPPAFCAGADLGELGSFGDTAAPGQAPGDALRAIYEGFLRVLRSSLPVVAAVNGPAVGAGFNLALACDVRLTCPEARFDARFLQLGLHPGGGHLWLLERAAGPEVAAAVCLLGEIPDGRRAVEVGLAWRCHPAEELLMAAERLAGGAAGVDRELMRRAKHTLRAAPFQPDFEAAVRTELEHQVWSFRRER